ncbi:MAG: ABC transporter substrate-binding protein [Deltaproteobacteria bacterium]|nr:ABC transporter substrate-binding protein [Deltaproteobacteria bacterium]
MNGRLSVAHSVDLDDAFMFWALATGRLDPKPHGVSSVEFRAADTETLNRCAADGKADVVAVSIAAVPELRDYLLLPHGGSVGRGYGPVVVAREPLAARDLSGRRVGIPGARTTAARLLAGAAPKAEPVVVPFHGSFDALEAGEVDAALLIHEGRLVYRKLGYHLVLDLGEWWTNETGLPLPLGGNVIRRALGAERIATVSQMLRESIAMALARRDEAIDELLATRPSMSRGDASEYLSLYANQDTLDYGPEGRRAISRLLGMDVEWAP